MNKPNPKREVAIRLYYPTLMIIDFYATEDAATEFREFGQLERDPMYTNGWHLIIDSRFDFEEVLRYIENYG